jgi:hypothetical protein
LWLAGAGVQRSGQSLRPVEIDIGDREFPNAQRMQCVAHRRAGSPRTD